MRVNVLEVSARWGAAARTLEDVAAALADAPACDLVLLPELALTGYVSPRAIFDPTPFAEDDDGPTSRAVADLARRLRSAVVAPLVRRTPRGITNAMVAFDAAGERLFTYDKRHPWIPETWATPGDASPPVVTVAGARTTVQVCYDVHFAPEDVARELEAADLLLFPSAWVDEENTRLPTLAALAQRFGVWIAAANWSEGVVRVPGQGDTCVLDPSGRVVARARGLAKGGVEVVTADIAPRSRVHT